jgi:dephospho-CoA kinase
MKKPKLLVIGHGRHGKDTVCEILRDQYGYSFESSSRFCSRLFIYNDLKDKYGYTNEEECYADRHNHRQEWYEAICDYNVPDASQLGREIFHEHDIYCGLRNKKEFHAMKNTGVFDYSIWVDRSDHLPEEAKTSMSLEQWMADFTIDNNGGLEELHFNVDQLIRHIDAYSAS